MSLFVLISRAGKVGEDMSQVKSLSILSMIVNVLAIACMIFFDFWKGIEVLQVGVLLIILAGVLHVVEWGKKNYE